MRNYISVEVLEKALQIVEKSGGGKDSLYRNGKYCLIGAINRAAHRRQSFQSVDVVLDAEGFADMNDGAVDAKAFQIKTLKKMIAKANKTGGKLFEF